MAIKGLREGNRDGKELEATFDRLKAKGKAAYGLGNIPESVLKHMAPADLADYQKRLAQATTKAIIQGMGKGLSTPPPIPAAGTPAWKNFLAAGLFGAGGNTFMGGRALLGALGSGAGGSGGAGGIVSGFLGGSAAGGNFLPLAAAMVGLKVTIEGLRVAMREVQEAFRRGSQLYLEAAKVGRGTTRLAGIQNALEAIGIDPGVAQTLLLNGQFSQGRGGRGGSFSRPGSGSIGAGGIRAEIDGEIFGARRGAGQMGELQQLVNLEKEYRQARLDTATATKIEGETAKSLHATQVQLNLVAIQLKAAWANVAADLSNILIPVLHTIDQIFQSINSHWNGVRQMLLTTLLPGVTGNLLNGVLGGGRQTGGANFGPALGSGLGLGQFANQFQKIGFIMGGGGPSVPSQQLATLHVIAANTGKLVQLASRGGGGSSTVMGVPPGLQAPIWHGFNNTDIVTPSP